MVDYLTEFILEPFKSLISGRRRVPRIASSTGSSSSDDLSTTSSVRDVYGSDSSDVEEIDRVFCESSESNDLLLSFTLKPHILGLVGIGAQFFDLPIILCRDVLISSYKRPSTLLVLPPSFVKDPYQPVWRVFLHNRCDNNLLFRPVLATAGPHQSTTPKITPSLSAATPSSSLPTVNAGLLLASSEIETQVQPVASLAPTISVASKTSRTREKPNFCNPLFLLDRNKFGTKTRRCLGCYGSSYTFFRAIFNGARKYANILEVSHADIRRAEEESEELKSVEARLRKIWECLFVHIQPFPGGPDGYPVAGRDHIHQRDRRGKATERLPSTSLADASSGPVAATRFPYQSSTVSSDASQDTIRVSQPLITVTPGACQLPTPQDPNLTVSQPAYYDVRAGTQGDRIDDINEHLVSLHNRSHEDPWNDHYVWRISVLGNAICSIRSLLDFTSSVMYSNPVIRRETANFEDFSGWCEPRTPQPDPRDTAPNVHKDFIDVVDQRLRRFRAQVCSSPNEAQRAWRTSVLDIAIQKIRFILDDANRNVYWPPPTGQSIVNDNGLSHSLPQATSLSTTSSDVSRSSAATSSSNTFASSAPTSTAINFDNEQVASAHSKS